MLLEHVRFSFKVELASDAHIGDGSYELLTVMRPDAAPSAPEDGDVDPHAATIARDHEGNPFLPSTALKGALRKHLEASTPAGVDIEHLFGAIKKDDGGAMGRFAFYPGKWKKDERRGDANDLPYWSEDKGSWIATHVAISRETGAAEHMKLFNQEMLPAGAVFEVDGLWFGALDEAKDELKKLLAPLAAPDGLPIGSGRKFGSGALRFFDSKEQLALTRTRFVPESGEVKTTVEPRLTLIPGEIGQNATKVTLSCPGPFLSVDPLPRRGDNRANRIRALKRNEQTPVLHMRSLVGALRARAAWLSNCEGLGGDDRFRKPLSWSLPGELTPVERLFGVGGWRGLLRFSQPALAGAKGVGALTSIAIDRFSGAVLDSALFEYEVFTGVELTVYLTLEVRAHDQMGSFPNQDDKRLWEILKSDLDGDVLPLGHGINGGFGWFDVSLSKTASTKEGR